MNHHTFDGLLAAAQVLPLTGGRVELRLSDTGDPSGPALVLRIDGRDCRRLARLLTRVGADARWEEVVELATQTAEEG